jgi:beta-glucosidase
VLYAAGYDPDSGEPRPELVDEAALVARAADVAIVLVGLPPSYESEGFDREHLRLPDQHNDLVRAVVDANPNTVVLLANGSPVQLPWIDRPRAVLELYLGGQAGGSAAADVLFGDVDPGGRLAETFPLRASDHASDPWYPGERRRTQYREGLYVGYRWFDTADVPVLFPFGHGLSYTTFSLDDLRVGDARDADASGFSIDVTVTVTNTGDRPGTEVVQCYLAPHEPSVHRPRRELAGYAKVRLAPGAATDVTITLDRRRFAHWDVASHAWQVDAGRYDVEIGRSIAELPLRTTVELTSAFRPTPADAALAPLHRPTPEAFADDGVFAALLGSPVPAPVPTRPYTPNTMVSELPPPVGPLLEKILLAAVVRQFDTELTPTTEKMLCAIVGESPLRGIVMMSQGKLSFGALEKLLAVVNRIPTRRHSG